MVLGFGSKKSKTSGPSNGDSSVSSQLPINPYASVPQTGYPPSGFGQQMGGAPAGKPLKYSAGDSSSSQTQFEKRLPSNPNMNDNNAYQSNNFPPYQQSNNQQSNNLPPYSNAQDPPPYSRSGRGGNNNKYSGNPYPSEQNVPPPSQSSAWGYPNDKPPGYQPSDPYSRYNNQSNQTQQASSKSYGSRSGFNQTSSYTENRGYGGQNNYDDDNNNGRDDLMSGAAKRYEQKIKDAPPQASRRAATDDDDDFYANGYGQSQREAYEPAEDEDPEEAALKSTKRDIRAVKDSSINVLDQAIATARQANERGQDSIRMLAEQQDRLFEVEQGTNAVYVNGGDSSRKTIDSIKRLNRSIFIPSGYDKLKRGKNGTDAQATAEELRRANVASDMTKLNTIQGQTQREKQIDDMIRKQQQGRDQTSQGKKPGGGLYNFEEDSEDEEQEKQIDGTF